MRKPVLESRELSFWEGASDMIDKGYTCLKTCRKGNRLDVGKCFDC